MTLRISSARRHALIASFSAAALLALAGCGSETPAASGGTTPPAASPAAPSSAASSAPSAASSSAAPSAESSTGTSTSGETTAAALSADCTAENLKTTTAGTLTIATSEPVFEPWMVDNDPTNKKGFESAVAYAVADRLGFTEDKVTWKRVGFDEAIAKQEGWDFDINQFSITEDRAKVVDFSTGYYDVAQTVIAVKGSAIEKATTVAELKTAKLGAMLGTTSLGAINKVIAPDAKPSVFKDNSLAKQALENGQIDGLVVDLPTAFYMVGAELTDGMIVGQLPGTSSDAEQLGLLLAKGSPITSCVSEAVDSLRADGSLDKLVDEWLSAEGAPVLK